MSCPVSVGKRKRFSCAEKYAILQELDKGVKRTFVQEKYGVAHGTLAGFIKNREEIVAKVKKATRRQWMPRALGSRVFLSWTKHSLCFVEKAPLCRKLILPRFGVHIVLEIPRSDIVTDRK